MKAVVTGGAGFIGSHAAERLAKEGYDVVAIDNLSRGKLLGKDIPSDYNWNFLSHIRGIRLLKADIRDLSSIKDAFRDAEFVVHAAAQTAATVALSNPVVDFEINALGTLNVLEATRRYSDEAVLIYCSTNKVYGDNVNRIPIVERKTRYEFKDMPNGVPINFSTDHCEHSPYGSSKLTGDIYVQDYGRSYGMNTGVFRQSGIYGTRQIGVPDQGWMAWLTIAMVTGKKITIFGDGKQVRDVLYVDDLVDAFLGFGRKARELKGEAFNIGGGPKNTLSLLELITLLEGMGVRRAKTQRSDWRPGDQKVYVSDVSKAKRKFGWEPKTGVREGVSRLLEWVKNERRLFT